MSFAIFVILSAIFIGIAYFFVFAEPKEKSEDFDEQSDDEPEVIHRRGAFENARQRRAQREDGQEEQKEQTEAEKIAELLRDKRVNMNKKEIRKLELRQQRLEQQEAMAQQKQHQENLRNEREVEQENKDELQRKKDEMREAEEERIQFEKEQKEKQEFEKWSNLISVDDSGEVGQLTQEQKEQKTQKFIDFIELRKVVMLDDLAAEFGMLTKDVVKKIEGLEKNGKLTGITDDRGKFIHITKTEFQAVQEYILAQGRVNRASLLQNANRLVRMTPTEEGKVQIEAEKQAMMAKVQDKLSKQDQN